MLGRRDTLLLAAATLAPVTAAAQPVKRLRMGVGLAPNSIDPHYHNTGQNNSALRHVFDTLCNEMGLEEIEPCLATSWKMLDATTWQFNLRQGVTRGGSGNSDRAIGGFPA